MKAVMLEPGREARALHIPHTLKAMQQAVGGTIQAIYPWKGVSAALVCDDEGLLKRLPFNRMVAPEVFIFGPCFICGVDGENFADLPEALVERFVKRYRFPELLFRHGGKLYSLPVEL